MPSYSDQQILDRMKGGPDAKREQSFEKAYGQYQTTHDPAMVEQMQKWAGLIPGYGAATPDAKNAARMYLAKMTGSTPEYTNAGDAEGVFHGAGHLLGGVMKTVAPFAGLIPGIGMPLAAGLAAGGSALGRALHGDKFNLGKTLMAGAAGYGGAKADLGHKVFGGGVPGAPDVSQMGDSVFHAGGGAAPGAVGAAGGGGGGILGKMGISGGDVMKYAPLAIGSLGAYGSYQDANKANGLRDQAMKMAGQDYASRGVFRDRAAGIAGAPMPQREDLSGIFSDPNNRWARPLQRAA